MGHYPQKIPVDPRGAPQNPRREPCRGLREPSKRQISSEPRGASDYHKVTLQNFGTKTIPNTENLLDHMIIAV